jgi:hypothetical protein
MIQFYIFIDENFITGSVKMFVECWPNWNGEKLDLEDVFVVATIYICILKLLASNFCPILSEYFFDSTVFLGESQGTTFTETTAATFRILTNSPIFHDLRSKYFFY